MINVSSQRASLQASAGGASETIQLPDGRILTAEEFYAERDARTTADRAFALGVFNVAVVLSGPLVDTVEGQTALLWTCSMLRRMGRPFAKTVIVAPKAAPGRPYRAALHRDVGVNTLEEAVELELLSADPFGPLEWRALGDDSALADAHMAVWIGGRDTGQPGEPPYGQVVVDARGWVAFVAYTAPDAAPIPRPTDDATAFDVPSAAAAAVVAAAAFGVGVVYRVAQSAAGAGENGTSEAEASRLEPSAVWFSVESGAATTTSREGIDWMSRGAARANAAPWAPDPEIIPPSLDQLTLVSAGALAGNASHIVAASYFSVARATVIEFDRTAVSNLNRQIGVGVNAVGDLKAEPVRAALQAAGISTSIAPQRYEAWSASGEAKRLASPRNAVIVGVDQVITRLHVQGDWPALLINGATGGTTWHVSAHPRPTEPGCGCLGCLYAAARQPYGEIRRPLACAAGERAEMSMPRALRPMASYSFASVSAAAVMVATLIDHVWHGGGARVVRASSITPANAKAGPLLESEACRLLCGHPAVRAVLYGNQLTPGLPDAFGVARPPLELSDSPPVEMGSPNARKAEGTLRGTPIPECTQDQSEGHARE